MTANRQQRRAGAAIETKKAELSAKAIPNISGTDERCGNCHFAGDRTRHKAIVDALIDDYTRRAKAGKLLMGEMPPTCMPLDETVCLENPQERAKKVWGWCAKWQARVGK